MIVDEITLIGTSAPDGKYLLAGTVEDSSGPLSGRLVLALDISSGSFYFAATITASDGSWSLTGLPYLDPASLLVLGVDQEGDKNAAVFAGIEMVAMT